MESFTIIITEIDEYYFKTIVGRKPYSEDELFTFTKNIKKDIENSINWTTISQNIKGSITLSDSKNKGIENDQSNQRKKSKSCMG